MLGRMGLTKSVLAGGLALGLSAGLANAGIIAQWTFETNIPTSITDNTNGSTVSPETGSGSLQGIHAGSASDWSSPAGNGSTHSYSVNTWAVGDYFQFSTSTTGLGGIQVSFDQVSSSTGPRDFSIQYSLNGTTFTLFSSYVVLPNQTAAPGVGTWGSSIAITGTSYTFDFSSITALNNAATVYFRLVDASTTASKNDGSLVASGGTDRIDNVTVSSVPEPASLGLLALGGGMMLVRRRRQA